MIAEPSPSMEVRSGTVYFNAETQQPELRVGGIYYGPAGQQQPTSTGLPVKRPNSAIPIVNPQVHILTDFVEDRSCFDVVIAFYSINELVFWVLS